jgi:hypothetical protein
MYYAYPPDNTFPYVSQALVYYLSGASIAFGSSGAPDGYPWDNDVFKDTSGSGRLASHVFYQFDDDMLKDLSGNGLPGIIDPWGVPLFYNAPSGANANPLHNVQGFDLVSAGVDGNLGTDDDLANYSDSKTGYSSSVTKWKPAE